MNEIDYDRMMVDDVYTIIIQKKNPWPFKWPRARKIQLVDRLIEYYENTNEYEKCQSLKLKRHQLENQTM
jgi:hypothetical protein